MTTSGPYHFPVDEFSQSFVLLIPADSGDVVKLCVAGTSAAGPRQVGAKPPSSIVACAIRRVSKKNDVMNAGKFSGGKKP